MDDNDQLHHSYPTPNRLSRGRTRARRNDSPLTRQRKKQIIQEEKADNVFLENSLNDSSTHHMKTATTFNDDPRHLYGLDNDQSIDDDGNNNLLHIIQSPTKKTFEEKRGDSVQVKESPYECAYGWICCSMKELLKYNAIVTCCIITFSVLLWSYSNHNHREDGKKFDEHLVNINTAKLESLHRQVKKLEQLIKAQDINYQHIRELKASNDELHRSVSAVSSKLSTLVSSFEERFIFLINNITAMDIKLKSLNEEIVKMVSENQSSKVSIEDCRKQISSVEVDVQLMGKKMMDIVQQEVNNVSNEIKGTIVRVVEEEITRAFKKEKEKDYTRNSLCVGEECKLRSSNTVALIQSALEVNRADTLGLADFALISGGGSIHDYHYSQTCDGGAPVIEFFGLPLYRDPRAPRAVITADRNPGDCWPMKGTEGYLVVKLATAIHPTMVSLEHVDKKLDRYSKYIYEMAPRDFTVYAWLDVNGEQRSEVGSFTYRREDSAIQTFSLKRKKALKAVLYMELRVLNNYGNSDCTCIYRFRVHGEPYSWDDHHK